MTGRPPESDPGYGGTPASSWGPWIQHLFGDRPPFVSTDIDALPRAPFGDAVDYRTETGRGVGRNWSPPWGSIKWFRLSATHPYYETERQRRTNADRKCGTCRHFAGVRYPSRPGWKRAAGRCGWPVPEVGPLPDSIPIDRRDLYAPARRYSVWPDMGETCPTWEAAS